jgi:hypothetical protein
MYDDGWDKMKKTKYPHYYGDIVRRLFLTGGGIMLLTLPFLKEYTNVRTILSTFIILVIAFLAGITNPKQKWTMYLDSSTSIIALIVFEFAAVQVFQTSSFSGFFWVNQTLAIIFFFSLYFSIKTLRGSTYRG